MFVLQSTTFLIQLHESNKPERKKSNFKGKETLLHLLTARTHQQGL